MTKACVPVFAGNAQTPIGLAGKKAPELTTEVVVAASAGRAVTPTIPTAPPPTRHTLTMAAPKRRTRKRRAERDSKARAIISPKLRLDTDRRPAATVWFIVECKRLPNACNDRSWGFGPGGVRYRGSVTPKKWQSGCKRK